MHVTYLVASFSALLYALNIVSEILSRLRSLLYRARLYRADFTHKCTTTTSNGKSGKSLITDVKEFVYIVYRALAVIVNVNPGLPFPILRSP